MERGPLALFGALIAIGLGPAMWVGAQFGEAASAATTPASITVQQESAKGGVGGAAPVNPANVADTDPKSNVEPLSPAHPKAHAASTSPSPTASATPSESASTSPTPGDHDNSTAPTADPTQSDPPSGGGSSTPPGGGDGGGGGGNGGGGDGGGGTGSGGGNAGGGQVPPAPPTDSDTPISNISPAV